MIIINYDICLQNIFRQKIFWLKFVRASVGRVGSGKRGRREGTGWNQLELPTTQTSLGKSIGLSRAQSLHTGQPCWGPPSSSSPSSSPSWPRDLDTLKRRTSMEETPSGRTQMSGIFPSREERGRYSTLTRETRSGRSKIFFTSKNSKFCLGLHSNHSRAYWGPGQD